MVLEFSSVKSFFGLLKFKYIQLQDLSSSLRHYLILFKCFLNSSTPNFLPFLNQTYFLLFVWIYQNYISNSWTKMVFLMFCQAINPIINFTLFGRRIFLSLLCYQLDYAILDFKPNYKQKILFLNQTARKLKRNATGFNKCKASF